MATMNETAGITTLDGATTTVANPEVQNQLRGLVWDPASGSYKYATVANEQTAPLTAFGGKAYEPGVTFSSTIGNAVKQFKAGENPYGIQTEGDLAKWIYNTARAGGISESDIEYELGLKTGGANDYFKQYGLSDYRTQYNTPDTISAQDLGDIKNLVSKDYGGVKASDRLKNPYLINDLVNNYGLSNQEIASVLDVSPEKISSFLQPAQDLTSAIRASKTYAVPQGYTGPSWLNAYNPGGTLGDVAGAKANQIALARAFYESYGRDPNPSEMDRLVSSSQTNEGLQNTIKSLKGGKASDIQALYDELRGYNQAVVRDKTLSPDEIMNLGLGNIEDIGAGRQGYADAIKALKSSDPNAYYQLKARSNPNELLNKVNSTYGGADVVGQVNNIPMFIDHRGKLFIGDEQISGNGDYLLHAIRKYGLTADELKKFNELYKEVAGTLPDWARPDFSSVMANEFRSSGPEAVVTDRSSSEAFPGLDPKQFSSASRSYAEERSLMDQLGLKPKGYADGGILGLDAASTSVANPNIINAVTTQQTAPVINPEIAAAYQTLFGREADLAGAQSWAATGLTGNALLNAMASGAQGADVDALRNYQTNLINQTYQDSFGRTAEQEGLQNWINSGLTGTALQDAIRSGARGADIGALYNPADTDISTEMTVQGIKDYMNTNVSDPYAIYSAAEKYKVDPQTIASVMGYSAEDTTGFLNKYNLAKTVGQEYQDIGRGLSGESAIDQEGFNYWYNQLQSGAITPEQFEQAFLTGARDVTSKGYEDQYVNANVIAESLAKGYGGFDLLDKTNALDVYEVLGKKGIAVEDILAKNPNLTAEQVSAYIDKVPDLYGEYVNNTFDSVFGSGTSASISDEYKQNAINSLVTGATTRDEILKQLENSGANKQQEAQRIAASYVSMFGGTAEDAKALYARLMGAEYSGTGTVKDDIYQTAKTAFDQSLSNEDAGLETLLKKAANTEGAENLDFFKTNPSALAVYRDVGDTKFYNAAGAGGQYGYLNGIPILKASEVDQLFKDMGTDYISGNAADRADNDIGWDTGSLSGVEARGASAFGIQRQEAGAFDSDSGYSPTGKYTYTGDMVGLANNLGIDPSQFKDTYKTVETYDPEINQTVKSQVIDRSAEDQLYDAINEKTKDFLLIAGKTGEGKTNQYGETSAINRDDVSGNHASVLYKRVGDKYIPMENTLKYYNGQMELSPGTWFSDTFGGIASIPGIAELSLLTPAAAFYPAIKAAQTAALGGDLGDMLKSGAFAYAAQNVLPKVAGNLSGGISDLGITNPIVNQAVTQGIVGGGVSALTGGSGTEGFTSGLISGGIGGTLDTLKPEVANIARELGVPDKFATVFTNTLASLAPTLITGGKIDPTKVLMSYMMKNAISGAKSNANQTVAP